MIFMIDKMHRKWYDDNCNSKGIPAEVAAFPKGTTMQNRRKAKNMSKLMAVVEITASVALSMSARAGTHTYTFTGAVCIG